MKKLFILSFVSVFLLTGCGATETLSCSYKNASDNGTTNVTYDIDHEGDDVKKVRITYDYDFTNNRNDVNNNTSMNDNNNNTGTNNNGNTDADNGTTGTVDTNDTTRARVGDNTTSNTNSTNNNNTGMNGNNNDTGTNDAGNNTGTGSYNTGNTNNNTGMNGNNNGTDGITAYNNTTNNARNDNNDNHTDGVGTGTDGTTNDTEMDDDGIIDGVVGSAIDTIVGGVTDIILDSAGLRERHQSVQTTYGNITGFSVQNTTDNNDNYKVTYVIDYDSISDNDLARFNLSRDLDELRDSYVNQGFTCK